MNNLNSILVEGNAVKDAECKQLPSGTELCAFTVASNRYIKRDSGFDQEVSYFDVETWGKLATLCAEKLRKGRGVRVVGRLKQERWTSADGKTMSKVKIVAEHVEFKPEFKDSPDEAKSQEKKKYVAEEIAF